MAPNPSSLLPLIGLRLPPLWARVVGAAVVGLGLIWMPFFSPYYRVPASNLELSIPEGARVVTFGFRNEGASYEVALEREAADAPAVAPELVPTRAGLTVRIPEGYRGNRLLLRSDASAIDLRHVDIDGMEIEGPSLGGVIEPSGQFHRDQLVRESITDFIFKYNEQLSNYALAFMVSVFLYFLYQLFFLYLDYWNSANAQKAEEIRQRLSRMTEQRRSFEFWKIAAPSLGFLMTVSSLAAALHPSVQATRNAAQFLAAVDVAVISTFVGLMVRLAAHLCCVTDAAVRRNLGEVDA